MHQRRETKLADAFFVTHSIRVIDFTTRYCRGTAARNAHIRIPPDGGRHSQLVARTRGGIEYVRTEDDTSIIAGTTDRRRRFDYIIFSTEPRGLSRPTV